MKIKFSVLTVILISAVLSYSQSITQILESDSSDDDSLTLDYSIYQYQLVYGGSDSSVVIQYSKPVFADSALSWLNDSLNVYANHSTSGDTTYLSPLMIADELIQDNTTLRLDFPDYRIPWFLDRSAVVLAAKLPVISIRFEEFSFTGGAHPNTETYFLNYDVTKQHQINIEDIIDPGKMKEFLLFAEKRFRDVRELEHSGSLNAAGYWFDNDTFVLSPLFAFTDDGLLIHYNPYQIAPYSYGSTDLTFSRLEILSFLNHDYLFMTK